MIKNKFDYDRNAWVTYETGNHNHSADPSKEIHEPIKDDIKGEGVINDMHPCENYVQQVQKLFVNDKPISELHLETDDFKAGDWMEGHSDIHSPEHYTFRGRECKEIIKDMTVGASGIEAVYLGNTIKYLYRYPKKNGKQDLLKAREYIDFLIKELYPDE